MKKLKILSLFDGISATNQALKNLGIEYDYYASEINKYAISVTKNNFPNTVQLGNVKAISYQQSWGNTLYYDGGYFTDIVTEQDSHCYADVSTIDLLSFGFPCQDLSIAKKDRKGLDGERSGLFYEALRILKEVKPKYFLAENVNSMSKEMKDIISKELFDIQPIMINSSLLTAQNRKRLFWVGKLQEDGTYKKVEIKQPEDKGILLKDILEENVDEKYFMKDGIIASVQKSNYRDRKPMDVNKKSNTLKCGGDVKRIIDKNGKWRYLTPNECARLQGFPDNYHDGISNTQAYKCHGNSFTVPVIQHILKYLEL